jgi:chromosome segregation ATPase
MPAPEPEIVDIKEKLEKAVDELKELKKAVDELEGDLRTLFENSPQACTKIIACANRVGHAAVAKDKAEKEKMTRCRYLAEKYELTIPE